MANIWKENQEVNEHPNRNNFDLKFQNHLTMKMGTIYPVMCKEVVPGDSFKIDTAFGLKFMPLNFPVQSNIRAHLHYFYVPNRILWKNWKNFISGVEQPVHPYIDQNSGFFRTGSLSDYLGVPTTIAKGTVSQYTHTSDTTGYTRSHWRPTHTTVTNDGRISVTRENSTVATVGLYSYACFFSDLSIGCNMHDVLANVNASDTDRMYFYDSAMERIPEVNSPSDCPFYIEIGNDFSSAITAANNSIILGFWALPKSVSRVRYSATTFSEGTDERFVFVGSCGVSINTTGGFTLLTPSSAPAYVTLLENCRKLQNGDKVTNLPEGSYNIFPALFVRYNGTGTDYFPLAGNMANKVSEVFITGRYRSTYVNEYVEDASQSPFGSEALNGISISALPYRAYECCYNTYYRNWQGNQPFYVNGNEVFNQYITTDADGADQTNYHLFQRNYELDYLTSALPSPQAGVAPVVGMTALGNITITDDNGVTTAQATIDNDGTITGVTLTSPAASIDHARTAMNIASVGMNINDFRNVNSLQRFLETTLRKGYRYVDFIEGHFGTTPKHIELDMPEFIGGVSKDVSVNMITNMSSGDAMLGEFAGTASCFGGTEHSIEKYCDDYGFIVGLLTVVPTPAYSQNLPKHFLRSNQLDYFFPEFTNLGLQPITYKEVTPIQMYYSGGYDGVYLSSTFGYQRPNYDLVANTDEVHGLFRTELKDFLVNRLFADPPYLGTEFLEINPDEVNDIFAYREASADTIVGQVVIDIKAKRPVPRVTIPSLGR